MYKNTEINNQILQMNKLLLTTFAFFSICIVANAQKASNVQWKQDINNLLITYSFSGLNDNVECSTALYVSLDAGKTFKGPLTKVSGDVGPVKSNGKKSITWQVFEEMGNEEITGDLVFEVKTEIKRKPLPKRTFLAYSYSKNTPVGLAIGSGKRVGWYAKVKTNAKFSTADYTVEASETTSQNVDLSGLSVYYNEETGNKVYYVLDGYAIYYESSDGSLYDYNTNKLINSTSESNYAVPDYDGDGYYTFTGKVQQSRYAGLVGVTITLPKGFYLNGGLGYGVRELMWEIEEFSYETNELLGSYWAKVDESSGSGIEWEIGAMYRWKKLLTTVGFAKVGNYHETSIGVGLMF